MTGIDAGASATDSTRTSTSMLAVLRPALRARARRVLPVLLSGISVLLISLSLPWRTCLAKNPATNNSKPNFNNSAG